jgi:hypothetical protein
MKVIALINHTIHGKGGASIKKGHVYDTNSATYRKFPASDFIKKPRAGKYTVDEFKAMVDIYLKNEATNSNLEDYWQQYLESMPSTDISRRAGVICYFCILRGLDNTNNYIGFNNPAAALLGVLEEVDPDRFDTGADIDTKLDSLLADIRA